MLHKKSLGQNFIIDKNIIKKLVRHINPNSKDIFLEIGPGEGALTVPLLEKVEKIYLIEKDTRLAKILDDKLQPAKKRTIYNEDILKFNFNKVKPSFRLIGNLPYNISTEILFKVCKINRIIDVHFMLQREVVERMIAKKNSKDYGRLSIMTQAYFIPKKLFDISKNVFEPKPKVTSSYVRLYPNKNIFQDEDQENSFMNIVRLAFSNRRKMIKTSLKLLFNESDFLKMNIDPKYRAENLDINDYLKLAENV